MAYSKLSSVGTANTFDTLLGVSNGAIKQISSESMKSLYGIEQIQKDILSIRKEKADGLYQTVEGTEFNLNDSADDYVKSITIFGKSEQNTYTGKNLFDYSKVLSVEYNGAKLVNNNDGSFTISGTTLTANFGRSYTLSHDESLALFKSPGTYYIKTEKSTMPYFYLAIDNSEGGFAEVTNITNNNGSVDITQDMMNDESFRVRMGFYGITGRAVTGGTIKPMVCAKDNSTFEPFTGGKPSPSPEYPQSINVTGGSGNVEIVSRGKNLINETNFTIVGNGNYYSKGVRVEGKLKPNTTYTISFDTDYIDDITMGIIDKTYTTWNVSTSNAKPSNGRLVKTITTGSDVNSIYDLLIYAGAAGSTDGKTVTVNNLQIEVGSTATTYEPYKEVKMVLPTPTPLSSYEGGYGKVYDELIFNSDGTGKIIRNTRTIVFTGNENWVAGTNYGNQCWKLSLPDTCMDGICSHFQRGDTEGLSNGDIMIYLYYTAYCFINYPAGSVGIFKQWLSQQYANGTPVTIVYKKQTPTEEPLTAEQVTELLKLRTQHLVTNFTSNDVTSHKMKLTYSADLKSYIDNKFATLETMIAETNAQLL